MHRLGHRLYYHLESLLSRGPLYQLMLIALVILGLSLFGGIVVHITNPSAYSNTLEAIWWAFLRLTDPGYLGDDEGFFPRLVSTGLTLAGYVVFLGALVALMTNWLDRFLKFLASGRSPIFEEGHVLIIGWNERIHALVEEIVHTAHQFHEPENEVSIVILCDPYEPSMYRELMQKLDPNVRNHCRVLVRSGNPLEAESLERVDFAHAKSIILISGAGSDRAQRSLSDVTLAKVLMSMRAQAPELENPPNVVVEVAIPGNKLLVESVGWTNRTEAVVADMIMGRLFCQAIRFPGVSRVYHRLLTDTFGHSIVLRQAQELKLSGRTLRQAVGSLELGTPIGLLKAGGGQGELHLLALDQQLAAQDMVAVVGSQHSRSLRTDEKGPEFRLPTIQVRETERRILVVGWSTDLYTFLVELSANSREQSNVTLLWESRRRPDQERLEQLDQQTENLSLQFHQGNLLDEVALHHNQIEQYDKILLLADQTQPPLVADAENVLRYVLLERFIRSRNLSIDLVVELNDEDNRPLLTGSEPDVLMTGEIQSHLLAQVSTHRSLMWIFEELFTKGGAELRLRPLQSFPEEYWSYQALQSICLNSSAVALGYCRGSDVVFNPEPDTRLKSTDQLILVETEE